MFDCVLIFGLENTIIMKNSTLYRFHLIIYILRKNKSRKY